MGKQKTPGPQEEPAWAEEVQEWLDAMAAVLRFQGDERAGELLRRLQQFASQAGLVMPEAALNTPYLNTISPH